MYRFTTLDNVQQLVAPIFISQTEIAGLQCRVISDGSQPWVDDKAGAITSVHDAPNGTYGTRLANGWNAYGVSYDGSHIVANDGKSFYEIVNGTAHAIDVPGGTKLTGVNDSGAFVGVGDINGTYQGFVDVKGSVTALDDPNAATGPMPSVGVNGGSSSNQPMQQYTAPEAIADDGTVVGTYIDAKNNMHGFVEQNGQYQTVDFPGATQTNLLGIANDGSGEVIGSYTLADGSQYMFLADPSHMPKLGTPAKFLVADQSTGQVSTQVGSAYQGPVAGLADEYIQITPDNLNLNSLTPNVFMHSGAGNDALDVSACGGNNILDGSTGSNFLVGGSGNDTFYVDDRNPSADIWTTIKNLHAGDGATIWGITPQDFNIATLDNQGAKGATGLTFSITKSGAPNANLTIAGMSTSDLDSGKLTVGYGRTGDLPGLPGSNYMQILCH